MDELVPGQFTEASTATWEQAPAPTPAKKASAWLPLLDFVASGKIASISVTDQKQLRGLRIGLARVAAGRQMKLEFRTTGHELLVRESETPYEKSQRATAAAERKPRRRTDAAHSSAAQE